MLIPVTVASLPLERYRRCYEPGCSVGLLTRLLAARCDEVLATDAIESAVLQAREVVAGLVFLIFSVVLFLLAGGLILFLVRRALHGTTLFQSASGPKTSAETATVPPAPETVSRGKATAS